MKIIANTKQVRRLVIGLILFIIGIGLPLLLYLFTRALNIEASLTVADIEAQTIREAKLAALKRTVSDTDEIRENLDKYIVDAQGEVDFIQFVENLGEEAGSGVQIQSVSENNFSNDDRFQWLSMSLSFSGTWREAITFLALIESIPYKTELSDISLTKSGSFWNERIVLKVIKDKNNENTNI